MPSLSHVLPAFEALVIKWEEFLNNNVDLVQIIQAGLDKLEAYQNHTDLAPAYSLAMGTFFLWVFLFFVSSISSR
jgi:hypothetical protein